MYKSIIETIGIIKAELTALGYENMVDFKPKISSAGNTIEYKFTKYLTEEQKDAVTEVISITGIKCGYPSTKMMIK